MWIFLILSAVSLWALINIIQAAIIAKEKEVRRKKPDYQHFAIATGLVGLLPLMAAPFTGFKIPQRPALLLFCLGTGILYLFLLIPFVKAYKYAQATILASLQQMIAVFTLIFSALFLRENLLEKHYVAFFIILLGGFLISLDVKLKRPFLPKAFYLTLFASILSGFYYTALKYLLLKQHFINVFILTRLGSFIGIFPLLCFKRYRTAIVELFGFKRKIAILIFGCEILNIIGLVFITLAFNFYYSTAVVSALAGSLQHVVTFLFSVLFSIFLPQFYKEVFDKATLSQKVSAISIVAMGIVLLYL